MPIGVEGMKRPQMLREGDVGGDQMAGIFFVARNFGVGSDQSDWRFSVAGNFLSPNVSGARGLSPNISTRVI